MDPVPPAAQRSCSVHKVALDPLGQCVICRRAEATQEWDPSGVRGAIAVLVALAAVVGGVVHQKRAPAPPPRPLIAATPPPSTTPEAAPELPDVGDGREEARAAELVRDDARKKAAFERELRRVQIRVYTAKRCDLCRTATAFLAGKGLAFEEVDVDASAEALAEMRAKNPKSSVPTLVVDDEVIVGFGPSVVMGAVVRAADKRAR